jgi:hypothetical protein
MPFREQLNRFECLCKQVCWGPLNLAYILVPVQMTGGLFPQETLICQTLEYTNIKRGPRCFQPPLSFSSKKNIDAGPQARQMMLQWESFPNKGFIFK